VVLTIAPPPAAKEAQPANAKADKAVPRLPPLQPTPVLVTGVLVLAVAELALFQIVKRWVWLLVSALIVIST
jgi:hypothetical protein